MSSNLNVWGTFTFPSNSQQAWRKTELDEGAPELESEYGNYFTAEIERESVEDVIARASDAMHFVHFVSEGDAVHVRAGLSDDDWSQWTAVIGGLARAAASLGATGMLEVEDDWQYVGRLVLGPEGASWVDAEDDEMAEDEAGKEALIAIFTKTLKLLEGGSSRKKAAPKKKKVTAKKKSAPKNVVAKKKAAPKKVVAKKKAAPKKKTAKKSARR